MGDNGKTKPLSRSQKFLNYCKGIGALVAAATGIVAIFISIYASQSAKEEPVAKAGYEATESVVKKLSEDIRKEHDERLLAEKLVANDMKNLRSELQLVVKLLSMQRGGPSRYRPRPPVAAGGAAPETPRTIIASLKTKVKRPMKSAEDKPAPAPKPPSRALPSLKKIQQQAQTPDPIAAPGL